MSSTLLSLRMSTLAAALAASSSVLSAGWPSAGLDLSNSRYQAGEAQISAKTAGGLHLLWSVTTDGDVTANPTVDGDFLYFPDSAGYLYKVRRSDGFIVWKNAIATYTGLAGDFARGSPAVAGNALIFGNQAGKYIAPDFSSFGRPDAARVVAVDKVTGNLLWMTKVDPGLMMSMVTHSPVIANGTAIVGIASNEELVAGFVPKAYGWQWKFRGSVVALDVGTGAVKWKTYTVPAGYYGGAVWGSTGAVDLARNQVYMATGNNYMVPQAALDCLNNGGKPAACLDPTNYFDSIIALDLTTGSVKWAGRGLPYDTWNVGCGLNVPGVFVLPPNDNCPNPKGPDWDFAQGPMMFSDTASSTDQSLVGAGQKSGMFWTFRAQDGKLVWSTQAAPAGLTGGLQWGSSTDGKSIFFAAANSGLTGSGTTPGVWKLKDGSTTTAGGWGSLAAATGKVQWTTAEPSGSRSEAAVSGANGVVFGCNLSATGTMYALNAQNGNVLWSFNSGAPCGAGPSVADGVVYWGSGTFVGNGAHKVFAFGL
jgi:polyvinyl alcohol dehydrogenase (cytochrome)